LQGYQADVWCCLLADSRITSDQASFTDDNLLAHDQVYFSFSKA
jgi:hypothetical protein